jgi:hypothetical protein
MMPDALSLALGGAAGLGGSLLSLLGGTEQVSGATREELLRQQRLSRRAGIARIQEQSNIARSQLAASLRGGGRFDSGAAVAGAARINDTVTRSISDLESNLAREFISGLAQRRFASSATPLSVLGRFIARAGGTATSIGLLNLLGPDPIPSQVPSSQEDQTPAGELFFGPSEDELLIDSSSSSRSRSGRRRDQFFF